MGEEFLNVNTAKNNVYCKKLPDKCIKALGKWVDNLNEEEKMKTRVRVKNKRSDLIWPFNYVFYIVLDIYVFNSKEIFELIIVC